MASDLPRIYLDNAATSWPKLPEAVEAAHEFTLTCGASSGRGSYRSASVADEWLSRGRRAIANLIGVCDSRDISFATSGTHALNTLLRGLLRNGDQVITTSSEHNSLLRPLELMREQLELQIFTLPVDAQGRSWPDDAEAIARNHGNETTGKKNEAAGEKTGKWLAIGHSSNVTGGVTDLAAWCDFAEQNGWKIILDASQSIGYIAIDLEKTPVHGLAASGHKGLRGLAGTGLVYCHKELQQSFTPLLVGGTGRSSELLSGGNEWPFSIEAGNLNLPGIVSMAVAAENATKSLSQWQTAFTSLVSQLAELHGVKLIGVDADMATAISEHCRTPVLSLQVDGWSPHDLSAVLDDNFGIECRAGLHCAALVHDALGTAANSGTLRLSSGHSTSMDEVRQTVAALREILGEPL